MQINGFTGILLETRVVSLRNGCTRRLPGIGFRVGPSAGSRLARFLQFWTVAMEAQFTLNLIDLKRACRRLVMRLSDESASGGEFVVFHATKNSLTIETGNSSEQLPATVCQSGCASLPVAVFCAFAKAMRFHRRRQIEICFSTGRIIVDRARIRHPKIIAGTCDSLAESCGRNRQNYKTTKNR